MYFVSGAISKEYENGSISKIETGKRMAEIGHSFQFTVSVEKQAETVNCDVELQFGSERRRVK